MDERALWLVVVVSVFASLLVVFYAVEVPREKVAAMATNDDRLSRVLSIPCKICKLSLNLQRRWESSF